MLLMGDTNELRLHTKLGNPRAEPCLSFFCQNTESRLNNAAAILKGLIYLLLVQDNSLLSRLKKKYGRAGKGSSRAAMPSTHFLTCFDG